MDFEFDSAKSRANLERHGVDFTECQSLWQRPHIVIPAKNVVGETRYAVLGRLRSKIYMAIITVRHGRIRIISCHRADKRWEKYYETHCQKTSS